MSAGKIGAGAAGYFEREVASGREDYYAGAGEAPGVWRGEGADAAGLEGRIAVGQLGELLEQRHPVTGEDLGTGYKVAGEYVDRFGNTKTRSKVAAIDATFSVPKSVSELFAVGDPGLQQAVVDACQIAVDASIAHLDRHAAFSRAGKAGVRQVDTDGLIVGEFMHRTSRAGDPQLHFHLLVSNRVHCADGKWRALDGRRLYPELKTAGMVGQSVMRAELTARLGVEWGPISQHGQADMVGVPAGLMDLHSKRTKAVEAHAAKTIRAAEAKLGRSLTPMERAEKFDAAAVQTRAVKAKHLEPEQGLTQRWIAEAKAEGFDPDVWLGQTLGRTIGVQSGLPGLDDQPLIDAVLDDLTTTKSVWGRTDVTRAIARRVTANPGETGPELAVRIEGLTSRVLVHGRVVELTVPELGVGPVRASDGVSEFVVHNAETYTTTTTLEREQAVLDHFVTGRDAGIAVVDPGIVANTIEARGLAGRALSADQVRAIAELALSGDAVSVLVGPAGAGKSATIGVAADAWQQSGVPVRGVAVSAKAAEVLRQEAGIANADTLAKLLHENAKPEGPAPGYRIRAGEVLIVDEASMVSSADFARLVQLTADAEAKIVAVGDYRQLGAVDAGGLFRLLAHDGPVSELEQVWRFSQSWERAASLQLRENDPSVIATYVQHGRIVGGDRDEVLEIAFESWAEARVMGGSVIMTAADHDTVDRLNDLARTELQNNGHVAMVALDVDGPVDLAVGDQILTLRNDRRLLDTGGGFVRNGDRWTVTGQFGDGLQVVDDDGISVVLPGEYLAAGHVDYAYATTVHKAQGVTVDRAITIIDTGTTAEAVYVGSTRGRDHNLMLAVCEAEHDDYGLHLDPAPRPTDVIAAALQRDTLERTATEALRQRELDTGIQSPTIQPAVAEPRVVEPVLAPEPIIAPAPIVEPPVVQVRRPEPMVPEQRGIDDDHDRIAAPLEPVTVEPAVLSGDQVRELEIRRVGLQSQLYTVENRIREIDQARSVGQQHVNGLERQIETQQHAIADTRRKIEQIRDRSLWQQLTHTPAERVRDRQEIFRLEQYIVNREAEITGLGFQLRRVHRDIDHAEHRLGGRESTLEYSERAVERLGTEIGRIDRTLTADIETRAERVLEHGPDVSLSGSYGISRRPTKTDDLTIDQWSVTVARAEQHHHAWNGINIADRYSPEGTAHDASTRTLTNSVRQLDRTINPPSHHLGHDFGISM